MHNERLTNPAQERLGARAHRGRARRVRARAFRHRRRRGQRGGAADGAQLPRRARRARALARDLAGAGLPRPDDGDAGPDRPSWAAGPAHPLSRRTAAHPAEHVAVRSDRRAGARRRSTRRSSASAPRPSRRSSARRSAPRRCRPTRRPCASGRGSPSGASSTAS